MNISKFFKRRNFLFGSLATVITIFFIGAIILINFGLYKVFDTFPLKLDLTTKQSYNISKDTINFLKTIKSDVEITIINDGTYYTQDNLSSNATLNPALQQLKQYSSYNHLIKLNFIDINRNPAFAMQYPTESFLPGDILIVAGTKHKKINLQDLFQTSQDQTTGQTNVTGNQTEQIVDSSLLFVTSSITPIVAFTTGHSEQDATELQTLLKTNNYETQPQNLSTKQIDANISAVAIIDPRVDFTATEIQKLNAFLNNNDKYGKNVMVFLDPSEPALPNLEAFTREWGIEVQAGTVYDSSSTNPLVVSVATLNKDFTGSIPSGIETYFPNSKPLKLLFSTKSSRTTASVIQSSDTSALWVQKSAGEVFVASASDVKGPFTLVAICTKSTYNSDNVLLSSNVLVYGSAQAVIASTILSTSSINNGSVVIGIFNKLIGVKSGISIISKSMTAASPNASATQGFVIKIVLSVLVPLLIIALGIFVWLRRRHK